MKPKYKPILIDNLGFFQLPVGCASVIFAGFIIWTILHFISESISLFFQSFSDFVTPIYLFCINNSYGILGVLSLILALFCWKYYENYPLERIYIDYKKGKIMRQQAITEMSNALFNHKKSSVPSAYESEIIAKRIRSVEKRLKAEKAFIEELTNQMKFETKIKK